jgi:hypothetical protein
MNIGRWNYGEQHCTNALYRFASMTIGEQSTHKQVKTVGAHTPYAISLLAEKHHR